VTTRDRGLMSTPFGDRESDCSLRLSWVMAVNLQPGPRTVAGDLRRGEPARNELHRNRV
jgi:hypothetical protein